MQNATDVRTTWTQEPVIQDYFAKLNQGNFTGVSQLFAERGSLDAPFQSRICGREAIDDYLQVEARKMTAIPQHGAIEWQPDGSSKHQLIGQVRMAVFTVNVGWTIELNADKEITSVSIKLLAELQELLRMRS
jgi:hypothetical protein